MNKEEQAYKDIIKQVASQLKLPEELVDRTYRSYWLGVKHFLSSLPFKEGLSEEEFKGLQTSVNIPSIGKFSCDYERYKSILRRLKYIKYIKENDKDKKD